MLRFRSAGRIAVLVLLALSGSFSTIFVGRFSLFSNVADMPVHRHDTGQSRCYQLSQAALFALSGLTMVSMATVELAVAFRRSFLM